MGSNVAASGLARDLRRRAEEGRPIRIGLVGCGEMGKDILSAVARMEGIVVAAVADLDPGEAREGARLAHGDADCCGEARSGADLDALIERGRIAIAPDPDAVAACGRVDVVVDATGVPEAGARIGLAAMANGKHLVMMNVEADVTVGAYLQAEAARHGVVYSLGAGDEPSSCMELVEFVSAMGHRVVAAGKGKNNPLNVDACPDDCRDEATRRNMNVRMLVEFVDGSKTMVEMAAIANATGLLPDRPGMHGPAAGPQDLSRLLVPRAAGGLLSDVGRVDYSVGAGVAPGVFVVAEIDHPRIRERMADLKLGAGPYYTFLRPYHLTSLEVPLTCARAVLHGRPDMAPLPRPTAEVAALAKRNLRPGERLGKIGEDMYRGWILTAEDANAAGAVPCGLLESATVTTAVARGELITRSAVRLAPGSKIAELRALQDAALARERKNA